MGKDGGKTDVNIDVGARAEMKIGIQTTVPEKSAGGFVDAITDIIRPFSEQRGLRADHIRLQREDVAMEIALKARERLNLENSSIRPVSNKILVPLLESASNEDVDDEFMKDKWSNLLASAATTVSVEPRYIGILKELQGRQADLLDKICKNRGDDFERPIAHLQDAPSMLCPAFVAQKLSDLSKLPAHMISEQYLFLEILDWIDRPGCAIIDVIIHHGHETSSLDGRKYFASANYSLDLEILSSLGLLVNCNNFYSPASDVDVQVVYYHVTELGLNFFMSCNNYKVESF